MNANVGDGQRAELLERLVPERPDGQGLLAGGHLGDAGEVGAYRKDERLAGDADADDLACLGTCSHAGESS